LLKIDTEGYEHAVIQGVAALLESKKVVFILRFFVQTAALAFLTVSAGA
jgi:hypothetical protein